MPEARVQPEEGVHAERRTAGAVRLPERGFRACLAHLVTVWGIALSNLFQGITFLLWLVGFAGSSRRRLAWSWPVVAPVVMPLGVYVLLFFVSTAFSLDVGGSAGELGQLLSLSTLPLALVFVRGTRDVRLVFDWLIGMTVLLALYGIGQYYLTGYGALHNRIPGPFSHYQTFAGVLLIGDLMLVARMATRGGWRRPWTWAALAVINWALMLSLTRGSWVAIALTLAVYALFRARRYLLVYVAVVALLLALMPASWVERVDSIRDLSDASNYDRLCMVEASLYMIGERPLFGLGPGMVEERYPIYRHPSAPRYAVPHLHNTFLQIASERGLISLGAYLWLMVAAFVLAYRAYRREGGPGGDRADLYLAVMMILLGFNLAGLFEDNWRDTEVQRLVLFVLAVPGCLALGSRAHSTE